MRLTALALALVIVAAVAAMPNAAAAPSCSFPTTIAVDTRADVVDSGDGKTSLREAIVQSNGDGEPTTVNLTKPGTYDLAGSVVPTGDCSLTIAGLGARVTTVRQTIADRVLDNATTFPVSLRSLAITGGRVTSNGGGIRNASGQLSLDQVAVRGNTARDSGGGISNGGTLTVTRSTISGNTASPAGDSSVNFGFGGGVENTGSGTATLRNTTVSGNHAGSGSAADGEGGGVGSSGTLHFVSSTVANNTATGTGGNVITGLGSADRLNSLFVGGSPNDCHSSGPNMGSPSSGDRSMASDATCFAVATPNLKLGPLLNNGGPTDTHALLAGSAAIDGGESLCPNDPSFPTVDHRGVPRPSGKCDVGDYELVKTANLALAIGASPRPVAQGAAVTWAMIVRSKGPAGDATQPVVTDALPKGVTLLSKSASQGTCTGTTKVVCALGTVRNGANANVFIRVRVNHSRGLLTNTASVASPRPDAKPGDNKGTVAVVVRPSDGDDAIGGTKGPDRICGLLGDDTITGGGGGDTLFGDLCGRRRGRGGRDALFGGPGGDTLTGGGGRNDLNGGSDSDLIRAVNGRRDTVDCGSGKHDVARVDPSDAVEGCETVRRVGS